jgi:ribosome-binding factor A
MTTSRRQRKVAEFIKEELGELLGRRIHDPRLEWITVTDVQVSPDLAVARIYYAVIGDAERLQQAQEGLDRAKGYLRRELAARLQLRVAPQLVFERDAALEYGRHIDDLLSKIQGDDAGDDNS